MGTGETWLRPSCRFHVCGTQAPRPPGRRPSLRACPSSLPLPLSRWRAFCLVQPSQRPSRDRPGVGDTGMPGTSALSLGWRGNCRSEWWSDPRGHPMMGKGPLAGRGRGLTKKTLCKAPRAWFGPSPEGVSVDHDLCGSPAAGVGVAWVQGAGGPLSWEGLLRP